MELTQEQINSIPVEERAAIVANAIRNMPDNFLLALAVSIEAVFTAITPSAVCSLGMFSKLGKLQQVYDDVHTEITNAITQRFEETKEEV